MMVCGLLQQQSFPEAPPPYQQQQYYQGYPSYPPYPYPQQKSSAGGLPFYVWIGVGALVMWAYSKISGLIRGGPQAAQAKMMSWVSRLWIPLFWHASPWCYVFLCHVLTVRYTSVAPVVLKRIAVPCRPWSRQ